MTKTESELCIRRFFVTLYRNSQLKYFLLEGVLTSNLKDALCEGNNHLNRLQSVDFGFVIT